ncbi:MAG: PorV/PorQ family protein [Elusimicrobiota bacterium]
MRYNKLVIAAAISVLSWSMVYSSNSISSAVSLRNNLAPRAAAMGDAYVAVTGSGESIFYNPAGTYGALGTEIKLGGYKSLVDTYYTGTYGNIRVSPLTSVWLAYYILNGGMAEINYIDGRSKIVNALDERVFQANYAIKMDKVLLGTNVKYMKSMIAEQYEADVYSADAGFIWQLVENNKNKICLGFSLNGIGNKIKYISVEDDVPLTLRFGACYQLLREEGKDVTITADVVKTGTAQARENLGVEYIVNHNLVLRSGYKIGYDSDSVTFGLGVLLGKIRIDYAVAMMGSFDYTHKIGLTYILRSTGKQQAAIVSPKPAGQ